MRRVSLAAMIALAVLAASGPVHAQTQPGEAQGATACTGPLTALADPAFHSSIQQIADQAAEGAKRELALARFQHAITDNSITVDDYVIATFLADMMRFFPALLAPIQSAVDQLKKVMGNNLEYRKQLREQVLACAPAVAQALQKAADIAEAKIHAQTQPGEAQGAVACPGSLAPLADPTLRSKIQSVADHVAAQAQDAEMHRHLGAWAFSDTQLLKSDNDIIAQFLSSIDASKISGFGPLHSTIAEMVSIFVNDDENLKKQMRDEVLTCFPAIAQVLQKASDLRAQNAAADLASELARSQQAESKRREEDVARVIKDLDQLPKYALRAAYAHYIFIKRCYDARQGYAMIYISDPELVRATRAISRIEEKLKPELPQGLKTDDLWSEANTSGGRSNYPLYREICQTELDSLDQKYKELFPEDSTIKKDF
jgi:hypothetical protein